MARAAARSLDGGEGRPGECHHLPVRWNPPSPTLLRPSAGHGRKQASIDLETILTRFAALADDTPEVRNVRGPALAMGMDWLIRLPDATDKQRQIKTLALEQLAGAADLACSVYELAD